jgi:hypothetical protein
VATTAMSITSSVLMSHLPLGSQPASPRMQTHTLCDLRRAGRFLRRERPGRAILARWTSS